MIDVVSVISSAKKENDYSRNRFISAPTSYILRRNCYFRVEDPEFFLSFF